MRGLSLTGKIALVALSLIPLYYMSYQIQLADLAWLPRWPTSKLDTATFAHQWLETELLEPFDPTPIREYCASSSWRPNLIFNVPTPIGGFGNIRARLLDFFFFAIEAGAAIVLPGMIIRSEVDIHDIWSGSHGNFSFMFDEDHFIRSLADACPQMRIHKLWEIERVATTVEGIYPPRSRRVDIGGEACSWVASSEQLDRWLSDRGVDNSTSTMINVDHTIWEVDTLSLPKGFRENFPMVLRTTPETRRYAGLVMVNLASKHEIDIKASDELHQEAFYGAHLRTESDTVAAGWFLPPTELEYGVDFTAQTDAYLAHATQNRLQAMYVATGNETEFDRFVEKAANHVPPIEILSKWTLLNSSDAEALSKLHWDQQALVDYEVMMKCSVFGGFAKSSFSFGIAVARNTWLEGHGRPIGHAWRMKEIDPHVAYDDGLSRILGRNQLNEEKCPRGCWP
ncbi:hypothetical protein LTR37_008923 [Vermiconidia calcicola]|uniref:Uncharacterized protein n=1 Tax=Vermiconidia calcicola TaxID=1690605 RepID=A0ACC3NA43_9PEZI|nr:hypothetical protein LTR37_008923 [Vermiconidia calcicola]